MWIAENGHFIGEVSGYDRGLQFGDGVFETMRVKSSHIVALDLHVARLENSLDALNIPRPYSNIQDWIAEQCQMLLEQSNLTHAILKLIVTRGTSNRGYRYDSSITPNVMLSLNPSPSVDSAIYNEGVETRLCKTQCAIQPQLAGLKHLNRLENVLARAEVKGEFEGLMCNAYGYVVEGTMSNLLFLKDSQFYTPKLNVSGVKGIMRQRVINHLKNNIGVIETDIAQNSLPSFDSVLLCNSVLGVVPIRKIEQNSYTIAPQAAQLVNAFLD
ncbi:aminodeoxychorismate lyase [Bermanella sp. R86510]|uniref:aminodeoxychorismate lyase n=1 Tax=unclassified Bermanella TaxID=2627862 RepID=UPI0037C899A5